MERNARLRSETVQRLETAAECLEPGEFGPIPEPSAGLRDQILRSIDALTGVDGFMAKIAGCPDDCLVVTDADSRITWANPAFSRMCGYSLGELQGHKPGQLLHGPRTSPGAIRRMRKAVQKRRARTEEIVNYHKDGHPYWVRLTISPVLDADGRARGFFSIARQLPFKK